MLDAIRSLPVIGWLMAKPVVAVALAAVIVVAGLGGIAISREASTGAGDGSRPMAQWLTIHYSSMDNNLDAFGEWQADLHSLEAVGSTPESHHVALYDGDEDGDTVIQYVVEGGTEDSPPSEAYEEWGPELNLGDPQTLSDFVIWAATEYPAENICLVLNNHGGAWFGICWDDLSGDHLDPGDVAEALGTVESTLGRQVDVVICYACLMASTEFCYEISEHASYMVGSQTYSWGSEQHGEDDYLIGNYPFDAIWGPLKEDPSMDPREFALHVVDAFEMYGPWNAPEMYVYRDYSSDTVAAIDLSQMGELALALDQLAIELEASMTGIGRTIGHAQLINRVIGSPQESPEMCTQSYSGQPDWIGQGTFVNYDLVDFLEQLDKCDIHNLCEDATLARVRAAADAAIMYERHGTEESLGHHVDSHGMSIWLPFRTQEYRESYEVTAFALDTNWDEFLRAVIRL